MEKPPAKTGWNWIKEGFSLFRKQPIELSTLFLSYLFLIFVIGFIPIIGQVFSILLVPTLSMAFMQACLHIEQGKRVYPHLILTGFRSPAFTTLLKLGMLYLVAAVIAAAASSFVDGGIFWQAMTGQIIVDEKTALESNMRAAMIFAAALYAVAAIALWFVAPLAAWQGMGAIKSVFYSFFSVLRCSKAFVMYAIAWVGIGFVLPVLFSSILALFIGTYAAALMVLMPISVIMTAVMYCSFYVSYVDVFGRPEAATLEENK